MKKDKKTSFDTPFYEKFVKKTAASAPKPAKDFDRKATNRQIEKDFDKPFNKRSGDKPAFKKSYDKPYDSEKRPKPYSNRDDRPERGDKPAFKKSYDKPYDSEKRPKPYSNRDDRPERGDKPAFKKSYDKPYDSEKRPKPYSNRDDRPERGDKPAFKKSYDKPYDSEKRPKPYSNRDDRPERGDKPAFKKSYDKPYDSEKRPKRSEEGHKRRVGDFEKAPQYNLERAEDKYRKTPKKPVEKSEETGMRLNKYIANAGLCSRREADGLIEAGQITINGKVINELGFRVSPGDVVKYGNRILNPEKMVYILVNKPKDYITTTDDPEGRHTVMDLVAGACQERVYPVGRLDRNTTGLLLLTNDGELAEKLMHPSNEIAKIYQVELDKPITTEDFEKLQQGIELEDGFIKPDDLAIVTPDAMVVGIEIHSGRNRIVRRMFEHLGYEVQKLDRTMYAGLNKKDLPRGKWRFLNEKEVIRLKYLL